jgi:hypothetical protein
MGYMTTTHPLRSIEDIKDANRRAGHHFFDADSMRFFSSRVLSEVHTLPDGGAIFVTSEQDTFSGQPRLYTVRRANPDGTIALYADPATEALENWDARQAAEAEAKLGFQDHLTARSALTCARKLAERIRD